MLGNQREAAFPVLVGEIVVVAEVTDAAHVRVLLCLPIVLAGVGAPEIDVGDDPLRSAEPVGEGPQPLRLLDRVLDADRSLDVDRVAYVLKRVSAMKSSAQ
jgi:hypothetical protein